MKTRRVRSHERRRSSSNEPATIAVSVRLPSTRAVRHAGEAERNGTRRRRSQPGNSTSHRAAGVDPSCPSTPDQQPRNAREGHREDSPGTKTCPIEEQCKRQDEEDEEGNERMPHLREDYMPLTVLLVGAAVARSYGSVSRRNRFSR